MLSVQNPKTIVTVNVDTAGAMVVLCSNIAMGSLSHDPIIKPSRVLTIARIAMISTRVLFAMATTITIKIVRMVRGMSS